ncbi:MAG: SDR family oxidoreductase [Acidobacteriota bacterium]
MSNHTTDDIPDPHEDLEPDERAIAVVGLAGRFPGADNLDGLWRRIAAGEEAIRPVSDDELLAAGVPRTTFERADYVCAASAIEGVEDFDADFFGYSPSEAELMDPQQRLFLEHAWAALEDAGTRPDRFEGLIGVYAGVAWNTYLLTQLMSHRELFDGAGGFQVFITNDKDFMPTRVAYKLDLKGPAMIVQTSCSTSLVATHLACLGLQNYECDLALVGGVTVRVPTKSGYFYQEGGLASPDGHCRTFDKRAAGTVFGSGVGVVALKRLADALEDGDAIRAVIRGSAINNDGSVKVSYTAPSVEGQAEVIAAAQEMAAVDVESLRYIECHGTATSLGDPIEVRALTKVFREATERRGFCALGSIKSNVGHLDAAAGVAGLIKTVLALQHRTIPPVAHFETPNPALELETSPFYVPSQSTAWPTEDGVPRRAGVSSFGVGGTNAHVIVEEAPAAPAPAPSRRWQLLQLSARSDDALDRATNQLASALDRNGNTPQLADVAHTLRTGRSVFRHRRAVLCRDLGEARLALTGERRELSWSAADQDEPRERPIAFLFSGQGSQYPGMAHGLYEDEPVFRTAVDRAAEHLRPLLGEDLRDILWPADGIADDEAAARLERTRFAQPALLTVELALADLWRSWSVQPTAMLGHSIGELAAACLAGVMGREDALTLVATRGRLMDELPSGAMLAVPLPEGEVTSRLSRHPDLSLAAVNEAARCVVSGPAEAVDAFADELARDGNAETDGRRLHTSHAFHSAMMEPILEPFTSEVRKIRLSPPEIPFLSNITGTWITPEEATDPAYWARHLRSAVRFADGVATLADNSEQIFLEVGPGRSLATLASRHPSRRSEQPVFSSLRHPRDAAEGAGEDQATMLGTLGRLWIAGAALDEGALSTDEERRKVALPTYPFERRRYWIEADETVTSKARHPGAGKRLEPADWFYLPSWRPTLPSTLELDDLPASCLILALPGGPGAALAERLAKTGRRATVIEPDVQGSEKGVRQAADRGVSHLEPTDRRAFEELLAQLDQEGAFPGAVIHAWALGGDASQAIQQPAELDRAQRTAFDSLLALGQALAGHSLPEGGVDVVVVADGLASIEPEALRPEKAPLLGLVRVLPQEVPGVRCRAVDAGFHQDSKPAETLLADRLLAEVSASRRNAESPEVPDEIVAVRGRQRWVEAFEPVQLSLPEGSSPLVEGGVYALTGGLQGNGFAFARVLAQRLRAKLVLIEEEPSRPPNDPASTNVRAERIAILKQLGAEVAVETVDLTDAASWIRALDAAETHLGPLRGILHAAGTDGEGTFRALGEIDSEHLNWHFRPKIHGTLALAEALAQKERPELEVVLLLSSLASVLGGIAYGAYAAANHFLEAFARRFGETSVPWKSVAWDVWEFEDDNDQITQLRADLAELAMSPEEGTGAFLRLAAANVGNLLVSTGDLDRRRNARHDRIANHLAPVASGERHPRPPLQTPFVPPESKLEVKIAEVWKEHLGFEDIGIDDNFFDLGGDSFIAVRVAARLNDVLETELPVAQLYQHLTVRSLATLLGRDEAEATAELAEKLAERRQSMDRRQEILRRRRARKHAGAG